MGERKITNENRSFNGVWIPAKYWLDPNLQPMELLFMAEIESLDGEKGCYASNKHFAEFFGVSTGRVSQIINALKDKGYLKISYNKDGKQVVSRLIRVVNKLNGGIKKTKSPIKKTKGGYLENAKESNTTRVIQKSNTNKEASKEPKQSEPDPFILAQELNISVNGGNRTPIFVDYINRLGSELVCYALQQTADNADHPGWRYLTAILDRLESDGIKTVEEAQLSSAKRKQKRKQKIREPLPDWFKEQYMQESEPPEDTDTDNHKEREPALLSDGSTVPKMPQIGDDGSWVN